MAASVTAASAPPGRVSSRGRSRRDEFFENATFGRCWSRSASRCHGDKKVRGGLKLTAREAVLKGGDSGPALCRASPTIACSIKAIASTAASCGCRRRASCPTPRSRGLQRWVKMGLPWPERHSRSETWDEVPGHRRAAPLVGLSTGRARCRRRRSRTGTGHERTSTASSWPQLEKQGPCLPAPADGRRTLIRRATFDLTGLPPTPEEVDAFLEDDSPDAFAQGRRSPAGLARTTASAGAGTGSTSSATPTRSTRRGIGGDGDIRRRLALPRLGRRRLQPRPAYDQFVIDQIAGDLLPSADGRSSTPTALIATGLLAIGNWGSGDADKEKMLTDIVDDQIDVVGRAFLGLTRRLRPLPRPQVRPDLDKPTTTAWPGIFFSTHILPNVGPKTNGRRPCASPCCRPRNSPRGSSTNRS